jgi:hypothetical protein
MTVQGLPVNRIGGRVAVHQLPAERAILPSPACGRGYRIKALSHQKIAPVRLTVARVSI